MKDKTLRKVVVALLDSLDESKDFQDFKNRMTKKLINIWFEEATDFELWRPQREAIETMKKGTCQISLLFPQNHREILQ